MRHNKGKTTRKIVILSVIIGIFIGGIGGFFIGIYTLPIIVANKLKTLPKQNPKQRLTQLSTMQSKADGTVFSHYKASFNRNAKGSNFAHRGKGDIDIVNNMVIFKENVRLSPGPDYRLYAIPKYTETKAGFLKMKEKAAFIAHIPIFDGQQIFSIPQGVKMENYAALLVWCEAFKQFISVAKLEKL